MTDKDLSKLDEQEFDRYLEDIIDAPPPPQLAKALTPWRRAMGRVLWGVGLTTLTLDFWNLDTILPIVGLLLMLLGFRALRRENSWFRTAYIIGWVRIAWWMIVFTLRLTVYSGDEAVMAFLTVGTILMLIPGFLMLLALRNGIRRVQVKAGLPTHGGNAMLIWYLVITALGLLRFTSFAVWGLLIAYIFILRSLWKLPGELEEAGYSIVPAPVKLSDRVMTLLYAALLMLALILGYGVFPKYKMDWQPAAGTQGEAVMQVRQELLELGVPAYVLCDLADEELLSCAGATQALVDVRDHDMEQGRAIGTQEEIDNGFNFVTDAEAARQLQTTFVGIRYADDREHWRIIHHFRWLVDGDFCGTEALQLWPTDRLEGWSLSADITGRVLCDRENGPYVSPYHSLGRVTYQNAGIAAVMFGQPTSTDVFAEFSYPGGARNARGYVLYDVLEMADGYIIDSWCNYVHQRSQLQFPVQTAAKYLQTSFFRDSAVFTTVQQALQLTTHGEAPALFD